LSLTTTVASVLLDTFTTTLWIYAPAAPNVLLEVAATAT
jgi:hypothetical protein